MMHFFCYCYCYCSSAALLCYNQSRHRPFQTVNNNEGLFFPLKRRKPSKVENKKTRLTHICAVQHLITCSLFFLLCFVVFFYFLFFKWSNGLTRVQPDSQLLSTQLCCKSVNNRRARITVSLIQCCHRDVIYQYPGSNLQDNRESASRKVARSLDFSLLAAFFARDLH